MQTKLPFFGSEKKEKNNAPVNTPITKNRLKSVWDYLHNINNKDKKMGFEAQYGKLPEKISQINKDQALDLNKWANVMEGENIIAKLATGETEFLTDVDPAAFDDIKGDQKIKSAKTTGNKVVKESLLKRYLELREDAFLMDYMDRYKDEINEGGKNMHYKSDDILGQSYKADHIAENKEYSLWDNLKPEQRMVILDQLPFLQDPNKQKALAPLSYDELMSKFPEKKERYMIDAAIEDEYAMGDVNEEPNEMDYKDARKKGLENPDKADISKDKDISNYELARGKAIQNAMKGQEVDENMELTNDIDKDDYVDNEGRHAKLQLRKAAEYSVKLSQMLGDGDQLPAWVQSKITKASDYMSTVYHYLDYEMSRSEDDLKQNMDNFITEVKKKLKEAPEDELDPPTTKSPTPTELAITLKNLGLNGNTIDSVKVVQTNIPTYKINLINGEGFFLSHQNQDDPFIADIGNKYYDMSDLIGGINQAKNAVNNLLTKDQFKGLGGDEEGGDPGGDLGGEPPAEESPAEEPEL